MLELVQRVLYYAGSFFIVGYLGVGITLASLVAVDQERKIWKPSALESLSWYGCLKVLGFNMLWAGASSIGSTLAFLKWVVLLGNSDLAYDVNVIVERAIAKSGIWLFIGDVQVEGVEKLPKKIEGSVPAPVFVANHTSQIDIGAAYFVNHRFKWISKFEVYYIPGVGQIMYFGSHVMINRQTGKNKKSVENLNAKSNEAIQSGLPMFIFPQGTRWIANKLPFKKGAFIIAKANNSPLIPVTVNVPNGVWNSGYPFNLLWGGKRPIVKLTIHDPIPATEKDTVDDLKQKCMDKIYSVLPEVYQREGKKGE